MENVQEIIKATTEAVNEKLADVKKDLATKGEVEALKGEFKPINDKIEAVEKGLSEMARKGQEYAGSKKEGVKMVDVIKEASESLLQKQSGFVRLKTVGDMTIAGNTTGTVVRTNVEPGINNVARQPFILESLADTTTMPAGKSIALWLEQSGIEGGAAMTAEGNAKSQLDWNLVEATAALKKVTSYVKISSEMLSDYAGIESEINGNLLYQIGLIKEGQYFAGTGSNAYTNGITKSGYAQTLDLSALANTYALNASNRWDAIGAAITQIETNMKGNAIVNFIALSPADYFVMVFGSKTTTGEYTQPNPLVTIMPDGSVMFAGIRVIKSITITAGYFLVGDISKYHIRVDGPVQVEMGYDSDDFTKNFVTIRAEQRIAGYIKANDVESFVYDTFANAKTFLERLT